MIYPTKEIFDNDCKFLSDFKVIAGVDEVGRGPLAGPVVVCAVIMDYSHMIDSVYDSKKLTAKEREILSEQIKRSAIDYAISVIDEKTIDEVNIYQATIMAMNDAVKRLKVAPGLVLVDAIKNLNVPFKVEGIIRGDQTHYSIACASIVAKVFRDSLMKDYAKKYPLYKFEDNKGYATKKHIEALKQYGKCPLHRESFIKKII